MQSIQAPLARTSASNQMLIADAGSDMVHGNVKDAVTCSLVRCLKARQGTFKGCHPRDAVMPMISSILILRTTL